MPPLVSIVIPVYNGSNYLGQAVDSALAQTYANVEVIVVNDGSDDGGATRAVAERYGDRIGYLEKENGGVASALNLGVRSMRGQFFSWLSHDDLYHPRKIEEQVAFYAGKRLDKAVLFSDEDRIDGDGRLVARARPFRMPREPLPYVLLYRQFIGGCSLLIPRAAFDEAGMFDESLRLVQDYDLWFRMMAKGYEFVYCPLVSGSSRRHALQDSRNKAAVHATEKGEFLARVMAELPTRLWLDPFRDPEAALYSLAAEYGAQGLRGPRAFALEMAGERARGPVRRAMGAAKRGWAVLRVRTGRLAFRLRRKAAFVTARVKKGAGA